MHIFERDEKIPERDCTGAVTPAIEMILELEDILDKTAEAAT